jgi:hypothetical protein
VLVKRFEKPELEYFAHGFAAGAKCAAAGSPTKAQVHVLAGTADHVESGYDAGYEAMERALARYAKQLPNARTLQRMRKIGGDS